MGVVLDKGRFGPWALVTGASSGIGKEFARQIAASGINIVLVARREDLLKEVGAEFSKRYGVEHRVVVLDVSREDFIGQLASATDDLDIGLVVSNAGTGNPGEFLKHDRQLLRETVRLGAMAHLDIAHHFGAKLTERRRGGIVLAGAMGAENGVPLMANDGAAKAYVHSLGEALHFEFKPLSAALVLALCGTVMANDSGENHQDDGGNKVVQSLVRMGEVFLLVRRLQITNGLVGLAGVIDRICAGRAAASVLGML
jgi:short-subunit dehydrogenase